MLEYLTLNIIFWPEFQKKFNGFWLRIRTKFPIISKMALNIILLFCTTYFCEALYSRLIIIKSKYQSILKILKLLQAIKYQIFSQDIIIYVKINKQFHLIHMQIWFSHHFYLFYIQTMIFLFNTWKIICILENCFKIHFLVIIITCDICILILHTNAVIQKT